MTLPSLNSPFLLPYLLSVFGIVLAVVFIARVIRQPKPPTVKLAWILALVTIPYFAVPLYFLIGGRKVRAVRRRKEAIETLRRADEATPERRVMETERILVASGAFPARPGNGSRLLGDGVATWEALLAHIDGAQESIFFTTFDFGRDAVGAELRDRLAARAKEGVRVRVLIDALGAFRKQFGWLDPIVEAGGQVGVFMPVLPIRRPGQANLRNHRKIFIFDEQVAILGGVNLTETYMGPVHRPDMWLDVACEVRGPVVADLCDVFVADWRFTTGERIELARPGGAEPTGNTCLQVVPSGPDAPGDPLFEAMLAALVEARRRVWIVTPYFVPDQTLARMLQLQAELGRDVRLIMPARSDNVIVDLARGHHLRRLHRAGLRVFLHPGKVVHAKMVVVDDSIGIIGSANLDVRSLYLNFEIALFSWSAETIGEWDAWMTRLMGECREVRRMRSRGIRLWLEDIAALLSPLL